ncbi:hypothetical protein Shyd_00130 [Streptomyces hydrogenans]|uniref:Uncharacterized protein n=1 Tax=Streptomyces hydrogenans TaxID=1873719 RepID=A0ABQ3P0T3_9ACTN|nr:hypothetical protein Shyd_00130 [Streptomyces hydrogenans]
MYRQLRKAFEDGKNEARRGGLLLDGECEMRRTTATGTPRPNAVCCWAYWLLSGYGLRASRAPGAGSPRPMRTTILLLMAFRLPDLLSEGRRPRQPSPAGPAGRSPSSSTNRTRRTP